MTPFAYPTQRHILRHRPVGYAEYGEFKPWLRDEFYFRCVYCLQRERWSREGHAIFGVDHILPQSSPEGQAAVCVYENLLYACNRCNSQRQDLLLPLIPTRDSYGDHLSVNAAGEVEAKTLAGEEIILMFRLNHRVCVAERRRILNVIAEFVADPANPIHVETYKTAFGYPEDLPDLEPKRPTGGNAMKANATRCHFALNAARRLTEVY